MLRNLGGEYLKTTILWYSNTHLFVLFTLLRERHNSALNNIAALM
jgi:hypothetical protein